MPNQVLPWLPSFEEDYLHMNLLLYRRSIDIIGVELERLFLLLLGCEKSCCVRHGGK